MSEATRPPDGDGAAPGYRQRIRSALAAAADLLFTRAEIFGEEASQKAGHLARGLGSFALALVAGWIAMLLLAALLASLLTLLFGHVWAGILAALLLYAGGAAAAAFFGWKALSKVRPFDFPVTVAEISKDWEALSSRFHPDGGGEASTGEPPAASLAPTEPPIDDLEARYRAGSE